VRSDPQQTRPSSQEGKAILLEVVRHFGLQYVGYGFGVSHQAVSKWTSRTRDIFTRTFHFLADLKRDGREDLAVRILQYLCSSVGYLAVKRPPRRGSFVAMIRALSECVREAGEVERLFAEMAEDGIAEVDEIDLELREIDRLIEAEEAFRGQLERLRREASGNGGRVTLNLQDRRLVG